MPVLKDTLREALQNRNRKILYNLERINFILRKYIGWQILAAIMIGATSSALFMLFGVPYPVVLGILCGLLNPIPIFGSLSSMLIAIVTVLVANPTDVWANITAIILIINGLHFINAYLIEPRILGSHIGLHPIVLLASLFIFGHFFGFLGLLTAVPATAVLMMFYRDWITKTNNSQSASSADAPAVAKDSDKPAEV
jgi:predicted PurR-regulated permease PerM